MARAKRSPLKVDKRRTALWELLVRGTPLHRACAAVREEYGCSQAVVDADLRALADRYRRLHDDPHLTELQVGAVLERLAKRANAADQRGQFAAATQADRTILQVLGVRSSRWSGAGGQQEQVASEATDEELAFLQRRVSELRAMDIGELRSQHRARLLRMRALGIEVVDGGAGSDPAPAPDEADAEAG